MPTRLILAQLAFALITSALLDAEPAFPVRVHVFEDYETDIEKRWWLRGKVETKELPPSLSASLPNKRSCRAAPSKNFDRKQVDQSVQWKAVIFNPVPGPPMGPRTRLNFRYRLTGTDTLRVQIYSLSKGFHRFLTLRDLPTGNWQNATVDMTTARRPDGSGGPLTTDERIDDIQFYIDPTGELWIDDIVLYEAAEEGEKRKFPARTIFTGWFDTGKQGQEWPGEFKIVPHEKPLTWDAAMSVPKARAHMLRIHMRGQRTLSKTTAITFRYKLTGNAGPLRVSLANEGVIALRTRTVSAPTTDKWHSATLTFKFDKPAIAQNIVFTPPNGAVLLVDDVLLYEP